MELWEMYNLVELFINQKNERSYDISYISYISFKYYLCNRKFVKYYTTYYYNLTPIVLKIIISCMHNRHKYLNNNNTFIPYSSILRRRQSNTNILL